MSSTSVTAASASARAFVRHRSWAAARRRVFLLLVCLLIILAVPSDGYLGSARVTFVLNQAIDGLGFRLAAWEAQALTQKVRDLATRPGANLTPQEQHDLVITYFDTVGQIGKLTDEIERVYADPKQENPKAAAAPLEAKLNSLRDKQAVRRPAVERILEQQTATVLQDVGLTTARRVWPPVGFQFTESPLYLIVSPRNRIRVQEGIYLDPSLPISQMEQIESQVQDRLDVSALVEGTGGFSSYPTMVIEYPSLEWVLSTVAHEWVHTYLLFHPLGWHYEDNGDTRTLNETTASIIGDEVGQLVMMRFYPELVPPARWPSPPSLQPGWWEQKPQDLLFEFGPFMRETRLRVDKLLSEGRIAEAETYLEARRKTLIEHGYILRKLNQAYFAFHGSYAVGPSATDPIGAKLRALRQRTGSLAEFIHTVSRITTVAELDAALERLAAPGPSTPG